MPKVGMQPIRRGQLIQATLEAVDQVGLNDASIALIARIAGVSGGIISHYFKDKNGLLEATMRHLMMALGEAVSRRQKAQADNSPRSRLRAVIEGNFDASQINTPATKTWLCAACNGLMTIAYIPISAMSFAVCSIYPPPVPPLWASPR